MAQIRDSNIELSRTTCLQSKKPKKDRFTVFEDKTATEDDSMRRWDEKYRIPTTSLGKFVETVAGFHIHLSQWRCAIETINFILPLSQEIDAKLGWSVCKELHILGRKIQENWDKYTSALEELEAAIKETGLNANHQQLQYLRSCTLKDTEVSDELSKLMTQVFEIQTSAHLRGYKLNGVKHDEIDGSEWWVLAGYILWRGVGMEGGERDETYFARLERSWALIFNWQFRLDMGYLSINRMARREWVSYFGKRLARKTTLERNFIEEWQHRYEGREFGADITQHIEFGYELNEWRVGATSLVD